MAKKKPKKPAKAKKPEKKPAKKPAKKSAPKKKAVKNKSVSKAKITIPKPVYEKSSRKEILLGEVEDYFAKVGVIAITSKDGLAIGQTFHVKGHTTDMTQTCDSMQIDHKPVGSIKKGDSVGIKVDGRCRKGDKVFRVL